MGNVLAAGQGQAPTRQALRGAGLPWSGTFQTLALPLSHSSSGNDHQQGSHRVFVSSFPFPHVKGMCEWNEECDACFAGLNHIDLLSIFLTSDHHARSQQNRGCRRI